MAAPQVFAQLLCLLCGPLHSAAEDAAAGQVLVGPVGTIKREQQFVQFLLCGRTGGMATVARGDAGLSPKASCLVGICEEQKRRHDAPRLSKPPVLTDTGRHAAKICHGQLASLFLYLQCPARGGTAGGRSSPYVVGKARRP